MPSDNRPRRIAVLGTGISSVGALASLSHHATTNPELNLTVDIFEKDGRPGGHTATVFLESKEKCDAYFASNSHSAKSNGTPSSKQPVHIATEHSTPLATFARTTPTQHPVDTGFIVMNPVTYPNMLAFLSHLNVPTAPSDMSFAVSRRSPSAPLKPELEWAGKSLGTVFCDWQNLYTGFFGIWRMIYDMTKFQTEAENMVRAVEAKRFDDEGRFVGNKVQDAGEGMSLGSFFKSHSYSTFFYQNYILPMTAAIWSTPAGEVFDGFPVATLVKFMRNHRLLELGERPTWLTILNGSISYLTTVLSSLPPTFQLHLSTPVTSLRRTPTGIYLLSNGTQHGPYDHVIMGVHGDQALKILGGEATESEKRVLGRVGFTRNRVVLHRDVRLMPANKSCWSSWNYLSLSPTGSESKSGSMCLTYYMNSLQPLHPSLGDVFVTVNPFIEPEGKLGEWEMEHPRLDAELVKSQDEINVIQNKAGITFTGAWTNYGFHEDGLTSSLLAAASIGYAPPFPIAMNGGYPTHRAPYPSLPGVADVKILAPKYTRKWEREQAKKQGGSSSWGLAIVVAGAAAGWYALGGREGVEKVAREVVAKVGEIVASFK